MLIFTGDINLTDNAFDVGYGVGSAIGEGLNPFAKIEKHESDCWVGNFEGVASDSSILKTYKRDCFRISPKVLEVAKFIDIYGIANNHVMEHGENAYIEMIENLKSRSHIFGNIENKSIVVEQEGKKVGIVGFSMRNDGLPYNPLYWYSPEYFEIEDEFKKIEFCDYKVAYIHWGVEFVDCPYNEQIKMAHWLIDLGFDLIIGMHPHVLQGYEIYKGKYIFYSLGNFVFNMAWENTKYGAIVKLDVADGSVSYDYIRIDDNYCPMVVSEREVPLFLRFATLNDKINNVENVETYMVNFKKNLLRYRRANYVSILKNFHKSNFFFTMSILKDFIKRRLSN